MEIWSSIYIFSALIVTSLTFFISIYAWIIHIIRKQYSHIPGPPISNFFFGNVIDIIKHANKRHVLWLDCYKKYGGVFKISIFHKVIVFATTPEIATELLNNQHKYGKSKTEYAPLARFCGSRFLGHGLVTVIDPQIWKVQRHGMNPAFHKNYLKTLVHVFNRSGNEMVNKLETMCKDLQPINLLNIFGRVTLDSICGAGFSFNSQAIIDENCAFPANLNIIINAISKSFHDPFLAWKPWKRQFVADGKKALKFLRDTGEQIVRERLQLRTNTPGLEANDILDMMIDNLGGNMSEEIFVDNFLTLFIAGQETTSNSLAFLFYLYGKHPEVLTKVRDEVDALHLGRDEPITAEHFKHLKYTEATIKEGLRLYPPATATVRQNADDVVIDNYFIPKGTPLVVSFFIIHRLFHDKGEEFNPDRFYEKKEMTADVYMPFSIGQRSCIGRHFAMYEAITMVYKLVANFDFIFDPNEVDDYDEHITVSLKSGCTMKLIKRNEVQ